MSDLPSEPLDDSGTGGVSEVALEVFETFLDSYHAGHGDFADLCRRHPDHATRFERWWTQLVQTGEVHDSDGDFAISAGAGTSVVDPTEDSVFGHYRIGKELGRGSQGTVFFAQDSRDDRRIALKVLPRFRSTGRDRARRFAREAELASRLDHPGLCEVIESGELAGNSYLAMRFVEGETIAAHIARARRSQRAGESAAIAGWGDAKAADARVDAVLALFEHIAEAVQVAHEARLIHRDIKPGNVVVEPSGQPVLLDFGLAREEESTEELTLTGDLVGTPAYMSPEQLTARIELDHRTDVYSIGVMLYECLTLHRPFEAATRSELYQKILATDPVDPRRLNPAVSRDLSIVVLTTLEKDRDRRYQSAGDLREDLRRLRAQEPVRARPPGTMLRVLRWARRHPVTAVSGGLVFASLVIGLTVSLYFHAETLRARAAFGRLASGARLEHAQAAAKDLLPAWPSKIDRLRQWTREHGEPLIADIPAMETALAELRERASPYTEEERLADASHHPFEARLAKLDGELQTMRDHKHKFEGTPFMEVIERLEKDLQAEADELRAQSTTDRIWRFTGVEDRIAHDALSSLLAEVQGFAGPRGLFEKVVKRLQWAEKLASIQDGGYRDLWTKTCAEVKASGRFDGFTLVSQDGLMPLGVDPESGLQEFAHRASGTVPPRDKATDELQIDSGSAMVFVLVPACTYHLTAGVRGRLQDTEIQLKPFFVSKFEMSRGQWHRLGGAPNRGSMGMRAIGTTSDSHPIDNVTWTEGSELLRSWGLAMPTEAQWVYAALGGRRTMWWWGNRPPTFSTPPENFADSSSLMSFRRRPSRYKDNYLGAAPVASFLPNAFGLHNPHGNVAEWCRDYFHFFPPNIFHVESGSGLKKVPATPLRAARGGSYLTARGVQTAVTYRRGFVSEVPRGALGLRPIRPVID